MPLPTFRPDLAAIPRYVPGKPIDEVAREYGIDSIDKLASNECPVEPFPEVQAVVAATASGLNRYPDSAGFELTGAIARHHGIAPENVWIGSGSSENLRCTALSVGGQGTSAVFAAPSFVMYTIGTRLAHAEPIVVPLASDFSHDLDAMAAAIRDDTTVVYVCNPNNPTGGMRSGPDVRSFIAAVPDRVTIVVDEAYAEYVTDEAYESMLHLAIDRSNVLVTRTFSKIYGLAGLRVGYAVGSADLLAALRTPQPPFSVNSVAQAAAIEALRHQDQVARRRDDNADGRRQLSEGLASMGVHVAPSQTNFVYFEPASDAAQLAQRLMRLGEIVRPLGRGLRITVGTPDENERFLAAWRQMEVEDA